MPPKRFKVIRVTKNNAYLRMGQGETETLEIEGDRLEVSATGCLSVIRGDHTIAAFPTGYWRSAWEDDGGMPSPLL